MAESQRTVREKVEIEGIGLHSGLPARVAIQPAPADHGLVFICRDQGGALIPATLSHLTDSSFASTLAGSGARVLTVEHLLSALHGLGVDNARLEIEGPEVPILDGSSRPLVEAITAAGLRAQPRPRRYLGLRRPISFARKDKEILALPANDCQVTYAIEFPHDAIGYQAVTACITPETYATSIAPARTFCLLRDVDAMKRSGLARGGSLENAVVIGDEGVINRPLRFADEFVRHKVLDLIGDLALLGARLRAHVIAFKGGHQLHASLVGRILSSRAAWTLATSDERLPAAQLDRFLHLRDRLVPRRVALTA